MYFCNGRGLEMIGHNSHTLAGLGRNGSEPTDCRLRLYFYLSFGVFCGGAENPAAENLKHNQ